MNPYIKKLNAFLLKQTPNFGYDDACSLLQMLYYYYTVANPIDSGLIRCKIEELNRYIDRFPIQEEEYFFNAISELLREQERTAFLEGIHVGARLSAELAENQREIEE